MSDDWPVVLPLDAPEADLARVGGKGASLARLAVDGLPVPGGFVVTTEAYRSVATGDLRREILDVVAATDAADSEALEKTSSRIRDLFAKTEVPEAIADAVRSRYAALGDEVTVAVRSSATAEDLPEMSFAGQQDTYLGIRGETALLDAVKRCWASLWNARAISYRTRNGIPPDEVALAVVVQELVEADAAGVMFTADPTTGSRQEIVINAAWGLGESVVGGQVTPDVTVVRRSDATVIDQRISEKSVMTVRVGAGTREVAVPREWRSEAVINNAQAEKLAELGIRIDELYQQPMDIEWAMRDGQLFVLQARPITGLCDRAVEEWNDSLGGDYLWSNGNLGEAIPDVMTPCTWSLVKMFMADAMASASLPDYRAYGNIGGRFYMNLSLSATLASAVGISRERFAKLTEDSFGKLPKGTEIPLVPLSRLQIARQLAPVVRRVLLRVRANQRNLPDFGRRAPRLCEDLRARVESASSVAVLARLWRSEVERYFHECGQMLEAATKQGGTGLVTARRKIRKRVDEADANALLSGLQTSSGPLASLGPLLGLAQLARGEIDRETFAREYGHRGPHEFEVSEPRPGEDPEWIDQQLAGLRESARGVDDLLSAQERAREDAWSRLVQRYPRQAERMKRRLRRWAKAARDREMARSEVIRAFALVRAFVLRAGELTGHGDALFFLTIDEILGVLDGAEAPLAAIPARRRAYDGYRSLPAYPTLIRGRFEPYRWAADPHRRTDIYDERGEGTPATDTINGFSGATGVVEGTARVVANVDEGRTLRDGDILVTSVTNIGWTPLFPRVAAVVTDIGAPLSHAAIVARELGIPAVVGCGNAMMRLHDGDRIRVDGERGTVEVLDRAKPADAAGRW